MKKYIISICLFFTPWVSHACDVCGCSLSGNYFGILPLFNKNFVGLRWSQAKFYAYMDHHSEYLPPEYSHDTYSKVEAWGRFYVSKKFQVFAFVPYAYNTMNGTEQTISTSGLGDITLLTNFILLNTGEDKTANWKHSLMAGGGLKLPTGKHDLEDDGALVNRNFQLGTGSLDFLLNTVYTIRYKKAGFNAEAGYKINTRNQNDYLFGNQFHASGQFFYWQKVGSFSLLPNIGMYYEQSAKHKDGKSLQTNTGGYALLATAGVEIYYSKFSIGVNYKNPVRQRYNSDTIADISSRDRWMASVTYNF